MDLGSFSFFLSKVYFVVAWVQFLKAQFIRISLFKDIMQDFNPFILIWDDNQRKMKKLSV